MQLLLKQAIKFQQENQQKIKTNQYNKKINRLAVFQYQKVKKMVVKKKEIKIMKLDKSIYSNILIKKKIFKKYNLKVQH